jgi:crossover junction endodeoxyribonuclease RusA
MKHPPPGTRPAPPPMAQEVVIELPLPPAELSPNARVHWRKKAQITKDWRYRAWLWVNSALMERAGGKKPWGDPNHKTRWAACKATVQVRWPDRRRRDLDNMLSSCKVYFDACTDAGVWVDDSRVVYELLPAIVDKANPGVTITVRPVEESA